MLKQKNSNRTSKNLTFAEHGQAFVGILILVVFFIFLFSSLVSLHLKLKKSVESQLKLDKCVGTAARKLRDFQNRISFLNDRIVQLRAAILAATLQPELLPPLRLALKTASLLEDEVLLEWKIKSLSWLEQRGCGLKNQVALPLPTHGWLKLPPDLIGENPLKKSLFEPLYIQSTLGIKIHSQAKIYENQKNWSAQWASHF